MRPKNSDATNSAREGIKNVFCENLRAVAIWWAVSRPVPSSLESEMIRIGRGNRSFCSH